MVFYFKKYFLGFMLFVFVFIQSSSLLSYGPIAVNPDGTPMIHQKLSSTTPLVWNPEDEIANDATLKDLVTKAWNTWVTEAANADVSFMQGSSIGDIRGNNYTQVIDSSRKAEGLNINNENDSRICACFTNPPPGCRVTQCLNPIVYDADGEIVAREYGLDNQAALIGSAGPVVWDNGDKVVQPDETRFLKMEAILNGYCRGNNANAHADKCLNADGTLFKLSDNELRAVMVHEFGHAQGLAHSQVNANSISIVNGSASVKNGFNPEDVPTMYPLLVAGADQSTLHTDDKVGLAHLYPKKPDFARNTCSVSGTILNNDGSVGLRCAEVVLRPTGSPTLGAISFISGAEVQNNGKGDQAGCTESNSKNCGNYTIAGLTPGVNYTIEVNPINASFIKGSRIDPCANPASAGIKPVTATGSITCAASGTTTCGDNADLCQRIAAIINPPPPQGEKGGCSLSEVSSSNPLSWALGAFLIFLIFGSLKLYNYRRTI